MRVARFAVVIALCALVVVPSRPAANAPPPQAAAGYQQFLSPASPLEVVTARRVDRVAWVTFEAGKRNAYTAAPPTFAPVRLTHFMKDDGIDMSGIRISDDGSTVVFVRGTAPNRDGWVANPTADPNGPERAIWAVRTTGGPAWRVVEAGSPELAPDGSSVLFVQDGQIYRAKVTPARPAAERDRGEKPFIKEWGVQSAPRWSPDGMKIAFVSTRTDHSFVAVYDMATRSVKYMAPGVDFDTSPMWTADSRSLVFVRRPGLAFGQQAQQGGGGIGVPNGPAFQNPATGRGQGRGRQGNAPAPQEPPGVAQPAAAVAQIPGLQRATFRGGYTVSVMKADAATGEAKEVWHNQPNDTLVNTFTNLRLAGDYVVFPFNVGGGRGRGARGTPPAPPPPPAGPPDEWDRYYSLNIALPDSRPVLLTTTDGLIEDQTSVAISADGRTLYYCTHAKDIERRHIWAVPVAGGTPHQVTAGAGIETHPAPLASGRRWRR
jgi:dipeptidyl-peptidase-4